MCLILKIFRKNLWWRGRPSLSLWSTLQESLKRAQEGEWNSFQSERGRGGGLKSDRGSPWRIVCSAVFLSNMESEVSVPLSLLQRTFEPHREGSWQSQTPPLCYLLGKSDGWIMKLSKLLLLHIPQPHVGALSVSVAHFGLIFFLQIEHLSCSADARISLLNFPVNVLSLSLSVWSGWALNEDSLL